MTYVFGEFTLDPQRHELHRAGQPVPVEPQVFALIHYLVANCERVISKDELIAAVWEGRFVSDSAVSSRIKSDRRALDDNGQAQGMIRTVHGKGWRFVAPVETGDEGRVPPAGPRVLDVPQDIRFCQSADGTRIAHATAGKGPPLLKVANWLNHLEYDWRSPVWTHIFGDLLQGNQLVRYDARGNGLSDWNVTDYSLNRQVEDLEAVVAATGLEPCPLLGMSHGAAISIAYAARHPERVTKLILACGFAQGWRHAGRDMREQSEAMLTLIRTGWGQDNAAFRQIFSALFTPSAPPENQDAFNEMQKIDTSPANAAALFSTLGDIDVRDCLGEVQAPTLVINATRDMRVPLAAGRELASGIPGARFVMLETDNHVIPASDPAWATCYRAIHDFLAE